MAITYHAGRRLQALSTDVNPTYSDDFSSDGWTDNDSTNMGVSGGSFNWNAKRDGTNDASVYDLTSTSANWVLRFKLHVTNVSSSTQAGNGFFVGLSDSNQTAGQSTSQDFIGMSIYNDNTDTYQTIDADGATVPRLWAGDNSQTTTYSTGSIYYYQIIKTGSSYTVEGFTGSDYSTGSTGSISGTSSASGLRYLKILNETDNIVTSTNPFQGTINALKFYDGVTVANSGKPTNVQVGSRFEETDTRKMYHYNEQVPNLDYKSFPSDYAGWTKSPNDATKVEFSSNRANLSIGEASVDARAYGYDIGVDLDGDYCMDFELTMTNTPNNAGGGSATNFGMGLAVATSDVNGEAPSGYNEMWKLGGYTASGSSGYTYVYVTSRNSGGTTAGGSDANTSFPMPSSATNLRYGRMTRSGTTHRMQFFSDSDRATTATTDFTATVVVQTLRYIFIKAFSQAQSPAWTGYLDNIKIYKDSIVPLTGNIWSEEGT